MADAANKDGLPYADEYLSLVESMAMDLPGPQVLIGPAIARGQLEPAEVPPVAVVGSAAEWASERRDWTTLKEVAVLGARAAAVWPRYLLIATTTGHPELRFREDEQTLAEAPCGR